jgi:hypothetical protein
VRAQATPGCSAVAATAAARRPFAAPTSPAATPAHADACSRSTANAAPERPRPLSVPAEDRGLAERPGLGSEETSAAKCSLRDAGNLRRDVRRGASGGGQGGRRAGPARVGPAHGNGPRADPGWEQGGNEVGTNRVPTRPPVSSHVIMKNAHLQATMAEDGGKRAQVHAVLRHHERGVQRGRDGRVAELVRGPADGDRDGHLVADPDP